MTIRRDGHSNSRTSWATGTKEAAPRTSEFDIPKSKNKKITIHQSGRVNYHQNGGSIYIAPLTKTETPFQIYGYRIPAIDKLDEHESTGAIDDLIIDLSDLPEGPLSFSVLIAPPQFEPSSRAVKLSYEAEGYSVVVQIDPVAFAAPDGLEDHFTTLTPSGGLFAEQQMTEEQAMVAYHQALTSTADLVVYTPNGEGVIRVIFAVPMRVAPRFMIELADPELYVSDQDVQRDNRSETVMLRFKVRRRSSGEILREAIDIRSIELDSEL
ncbi:hypothetical protein VC279_05980 [Xanthomonas sp. WHRI 10064A]|uniref:hypothetical protein n=1 Tax=unclassified Xanthomonas TaxID=2643310 RepID=UPI002B23B8D3|nr:MULTISPECIES: hypothetical protein [unclassified Xanthomonas]MEA9585860.1 hypothetical protein [Xanthomonas sp. WHRI 10064B]MEA9614287.1 hypothetical protein [Xanthomonas sp. WHRI 10064A]